MPTPALRIFIVENHEDTLHWLATYLEDCGHTVGRARTLAETLATFRNHGSWDVLMADIGLPDGSGWELLPRLRLSSPVFAIAMSGFGHHADSERSRAAGYRHHLVKPFKLAELDKLLDQAAAELPK